MSPQPTQAFCSGRHPHHGHVGEIPRQECQEASTEVEVNLCNGCVLRDDCDSLVMGPHTPSCMLGVKCQVLAHGVAFLYNRVCFLPPFFLLMSVFSPLPTGEAGPTHTLHRACPLPLPRSSTHKTVYPHGTPADTPADTDTLLKHNVVLVCPVLLGLRHNGRGWVGARRPFQRRRRRQRRCLRRQHHSTPLVRR